MKESLDEVHIDELLKEALEEGFFELYLEPGKPPYGRERGDYQLRELLQYEPVRSNVAQRIAYDILTDEQIGQFEARRFLQFSYTAVHLARFAVRYFMIEGRIELSFCVTPTRKNDN